MAAWRQFLAQVSPRRPASEAYDIYTTAVLPILYEQRGFSVECAEREIQQFRTMVPRPAGPVLQFPREFANDAEAQRWWKAHNIDWPTFQASVSGMSKMDAMEIFARGVLRYQEGELGATEDAIHACEEHARSDPNPDAYGDCLSGKAKK